MRKRTGLLALIITSLILIACGGGGGPSAPMISGVLSTDCTSCAAASDSRYRGSGVGAWAYKNASTSIASVPVSISGLNGQTVSIVYTNQADAEVMLPSPLVLATSVSGNTGLQTEGANDPAPANVIAQREAFASRLKESTASDLRKSVVAAPSWALGDVKQLKTSDGKTLPVVLNRIATMPDGVTINFWVENSELAAGKMSTATLDTLVSKFASDSNNIYTLATGLIGKPWGPHGNTQLIGDGQPVNVVLYSGGFGASWGGYFWTEDLRTNSSYGNAWLAVYLNTTNLYDTNTTLASDINTKLSTLAHEFTHMIHQYQRSVLMGKKFDFWLNELAAMSMEDWLASQILPAGENKVLQERYLNWLARGNFNIRQDSWGANTLDSLSYYYANGAFGAFLNRQYGLTYYKALFTSTSSDSKQIMDDAIKAAGGSGYAEALRRWGASIAMLPAATAPAGHGYPARTDGAFSLMPFDGPTWLSSRALPTSVRNGMLQGHAHFPIVKSNVSGTYTNTLFVPANTAVTVLVH